MDHGKRTTQYGGFSTSCFVLFFFQGKMHKNQLLINYTKKSLLLPKTKKEKKSLVFNSLGNFLTLKRLIFVSNDKSGKKEMIFLKVKRNRS